MSHIAKDNVFFAGYFFPTNVPPPHGPYPLLRKVYRQLRGHFSDYVIFSMLINVILIYLVFRLLRFVITYNCSLCQPGRSAMKCCSQVICPRQQQQPCPMQCILLPSCDGC